MTSWVICHTSNPSCCRWPPNPQLSKYSLHFSFCKSRFFSLFLQTQHWADTSFISCCITSSFWKSSAKTPQHIQFMSKPCHCSPNLSLHGAVTALQGAQQGQGTTPSESAHFFPMQMSLSNWDQTLLFPSELFINKVKRFWGRHGACRWNKEIQRTKHLIGDKMRKLNTHPGPTGRHS